MSARHRPGRAFLMIALASVITGVTITAQAQAKNTVEAVRTELLQLPYYSVFDFLAFSYDKGTVTLGGFAYHGGLKSDAVRAVKRVAGVDEVKDMIEELPPSTGDDDLRWQTYYAIYRDPFLSRYAPGGAMLWGHRHAYRGGFFPGGGGAFPGMEPAGDFPIHIIVKGSRITLLGVVDNENDKTVAGLKARGVPLALGVENQLTVERSGKSTK